MATGSLVEEQILAQFQTLSRAPFRVRLAQLNSIPLDRDKLITWANKFPDKLAQAEAIYGRLAGFNERVEVDVTGTVAMALAAKIPSMSDAELEAQVRVMRSPATHPPKALASGSPASSTPSSPPGNHSTQGPDRA